MLNVLIRPFTISGRLPAYFAALLFTSVILLTGCVQAQSPKSAEVAEPVSAKPEVIGQARQALFKENPWLIKNISLGGGFGNEFSRAIANHMYSRTYAPALEDARKKVKPLNFGGGTWVMQFPIVNVAVFETEEGFVLVDSGYAPAGPALKAELKKISSKRVHTIILSHHHVDHALGAWAFLDQDEPPEIVATKEFVREQQRDLDLAAYMTRRTHQVPDSAPKGWSDVVKPTRTFSQRLVLNIGGEEFVLTHARGETSDQLYVHVPGRSALVTADYYQRFIPNAGNGRRPLRHIKEWAQALEDMAALNADLMIPMHGDTLTDQDEISDRLSAHSTLLRHVDTHVRSALEQDVPEYLIAKQVELPSELEGRDDVRELYVSIQDIARMAIAEYTGWWDDMPSSWDPATERAQALEIVGLAGGVGKLLDRAEQLAQEDIRQACHLVDIAWLAEPGNARVLSVAYQTYLSRLRHKEPLQEALVYVDHLVRLRASLNRLGIDIPRDRSK